MRFCDKLPKKRKENNLSQEQLADSLDVSRQAVSKWESGSSYPDMEKMISMCKILDCKLEDLMDDGVIGNSNKENKINFNESFNEFLKYVEKTYNMFCMMTFKEKMKCIFEMIFVLLIILFSGYIIYTLTNMAILNLLTYIPVVGNVINKVFASLLNIALIIVGIIILIHLFKIRYLDYFDISADKKIDQKDDENVDDIKNGLKDKHEKIIIRDPKNSSLSFFHLFINILLLIVKIFTAFIGVAAAIVFVFIIVFGVISLCNVSYGMIFLWFGFALLSASLMTLIIIYFVYNFIFNKSINFKLSFEVFTISLIMFGVFFGLSSNTYLNYKHTSLKDDKTKVTNTKYIDMKDDLGIYPYENVNIDYNIDNTIDNVRIDVTHAKDISYTISESKTKFYDNYHIYVDKNPYVLYKAFRNDVKKGVVRAYDDYNFLDVKITLSQDNYNKLIKNITNEE